MEYLACGLAALLLLYALGLGLTLWLLPGEARPYSLIVAPWVGYWYATLACWGVYEFGGRISAFAAQMILLSSILCLAVVLFTKGSASMLRAIFGNRKVLGALSIGGAAFVFFSIPALRYGQSLTTGSLYNHDVAAYATVSRFLADFTRTSSIGFVGQGFEYFNKYPVEGYFGVVSFAAFLGRAFGGMPHQTTTLCVNLFAALGVASLFLVLSDAFKVKTKIAFLGIVLFAFHPAYHYIVLQGFLGQVVAMGLALMIFWTHCKIIEAPEGLRHLIRYLLLLTCLTSGLLLTYQHMLPFVWVLVGVYSVVLALYRGAVRPIWVSAIAHLGAFAVAAALCPPRAIAFLTFFKYIGSVQAGWFMPFFSPDYLVGLSYQNSPFAMEDPKVQLIAAIAVSAVVSFGLLLVFRKARETTVALWIGCLVIYTGTVILAFRSETGQFGGYRSFKFAVFFLPFFAAAMACLFDIAPVAWKRLWLAFKVLVLVSLSVGYVRADARLLKAMQTAGKWVEPQYRDLLSLDKDDSIQSVNILGQDGWRNMWAAYFLMHKKVYCDGPTYWGKPNMDGTYDLIDKNVNEVIRHLPLGRIPPIRRVNDRYYLIGPYPKE